MRKIWLMALAVLLCGALHAGETKRVQFLDGVYSLEVPADWHTEEDDDGSSAFLSPQKDGAAQVLVSPPNTKVDGDFGDFAGMQMGLLFAMLGGGEITREDKDEFDGRPAYRFEYKIPLGETSIVGSGVVVKYDEAVVMLMTFCPDDLAPRFVPQAGEVMASFRLDNAALEKNRAKVDEISEKTMKELQSMEAMFD